MKAKKRGTLYDVVKTVLQKKPETRGDDRLLLWFVCEVLRGEPIGSTNLITRFAFMKMPSFESITRARREVQAHNKDLDAPRKIKNMRVNAQKNWMRQTFLKIVDFISTR